MNKFCRALIVILVSFVVGMALVAVRYAYDQRDMSLAVKRLVGERFCPKPEKTLGEMMADNLGVPVESLMCQPRMISRYEKKIFVLCFEKDHQDDPRSFAWSVDLGNQSVLHENPAAADLVRFCYTDEKPVRF